MLQIIKNQIHAAKALLASILYSFPSRSMKVVGVTGTDGKTTTTELIYHILKTAGKKTGMISTVKALINEKEYDTGFHVTTPSSFALQRLLSQAQNGKTEYMVIEVTSHALDQQRVKGVKFDIGVITNISHEHIDYHKTFDQYLKTKAKLLKNVNFSVLNKDDKNFEKLQTLAEGKIITFGIKDADNTPENLSYQTSLIGEFNKYNILASVSVARLLNIDDETIKKGIRTFNGIPGRMEEVKTANNFRIFVDFAHKPNALKNALETICSITQNRVIVVFGAAGLRDKLKRPMMGTIAGRIADIAILTAEDPRTEDVRDIIAQIAQGAKKSGMKEVDKKKDRSDIKNKYRYFYRIPDRQEAINFAIRILAKKGDVVLIAGKGHEKSICYGKIEHPWDEFKAVQKALKG